MIFFEMFVPHALPTPRRRVPPPVFSPGTWDIPFGTVRSFHSSRKRDFLGPEKPALLYFPRTLPKAGFLGIIFSLELCPFDLDAYPQEN